MAVIVTFDVFSALTDSRSGGSATLQTLSDTHGWSTSGSELYDTWDAANKENHRAVERWVPFVELSVLAMRTALSKRGLPDDNAVSISSDLLDSMADWPLWPDVSAASLGDLPASGLGLLSNIDDELLAGTAAMRLGVFDPDLVVTSERAQAYKPAPRLYHRAAELLGHFVHVASSARDVRGAVGAGVACIRLHRPGHSLDATGPAPKWTAESVRELGQLVPLAASR
jgi:2-haloalkanoic acid dehalogenase type II